MEGEKKTPSPLHLHLSCSDKKSTPVAIMHIVQLSIHISVVFLPSSLYARSQLILNTDMKLWGDLQDMDSKEHHKEFIWSSQETWASLGKRQVQSWCQKPLAKRKRMAFRKTVFTALASSSMCVCSRASTGEWCLCSSSGKTPTDVINPAQGIRTEILPSKQLFNTLLSPRNNTVNLLYPAEV